MAENKKVRNATAIEYEGIQFKSRLERACYIRLKSEGFTPLYEPTHYVLLPPFKLNNGVINANKKKDLSLYTSFRALTYTPDFEFTYKGIHVFYDAKGMPNDTYPLKKKLFISYLENLQIPYIFFEPHNLAQLEQSIQILYELHSKN